MERELQRPGTTIIREVVIPTGRNLLAGALQLPAAATGVVLLVQIGAPAQPIFGEQTLAQLLRSAGLGTLQFTLLTPAEIVIDQRTRHLRFDLPLLARRLTSVTGWWEQQSDLAALSLGFCSASTGAGVALLAAAELGGRLSAVVGYDGRPDLAGQALERVTAPTLLVVGERDRETTRLNRVALERLPGIKALHLVPGAWRLFDEPAWLDAVAVQATAWFQRHLAEVAKNSAPLA